MTISERRARTRARLQERIRAGRPPKLSKPKAEPEPKPKPKAERRRRPTRRADRGPATAATLAEPDLTPDEVRTVTLQIIQQCFQEQQRWEAARRRLDPAALEAAKLYAALRMAEN